VLMPNASKHLRGTKVVSRTTQRRRTIVSLGEF